MRHALTDSERREIRDALKLLHRRRARDRSPRVDLVATPPAHGQMLIPIPPVRRRVDTLSRGHDRPGRLGPTPWTATGVSECFTESRRPVGTRPHSATGHIVVDRPPDSSTQKPPNLRVGGVAYALRHDNRSRGQWELPEVDFHPLTLRVPRSRAQAPLSASASCSPRPGTTFPEPGRRATNEIGLRLDG